MWLLDAVGVFSHLKFASGKIKWPSKALQTLIGIIVNCISFQHIVMYEIIKNPYFIPVFWCVFLHFNAVYQNIFGIINRQSTIREIFHTWNAAIFSSNLDPAQKVYSLSTMHTIDKSSDWLTFTVLSKAGRAEVGGVFRHYGTIQREQKPALKLSSAFHQMLVFQTIRGEQP